MGRDDRERFGRDRGGDRDRDRGGRDRSDRGRGGDDHGGQPESQRIARDRERGGDVDMGGPKRMRMHDQQMRPEVYQIPRDSQQYPQHYSEPDQDQAPVVLIMNQDGMNPDYSYLGPQEYNRLVFDNDRRASSFSDGGCSYQDGQSYIRNAINFEDLYESNEPRYDQHERIPRSRKSFASRWSDRDSHLVNNSQQQRILDRIRNLNPQEITPKKYEVKKFTANTRLYIGNLSNDVNDGDLKELFTKHGELDEIFLNRDKNFAFLKMDYRSSAEKARAELDGHVLKGKTLKVRFAPACVRLKVKNLAPSVSNELLETAFSAFGDVERALVFVDEKGKSTGEGIVDFTRKNFAIAADRFCKERCYFLSSELRPVETELGEMYEMDEGLMEGNLSNRGPQYSRAGQRQEQDFFQSREQGPRVAEDGSFEFDYGMEWKKLMAAYRQKEAELKQEFEAEVDSLFKRMELARYDYETEMLRRQLRQRELDQERIRMEFEQRTQTQARGRPSFFGGFDRGGPSMDDSRQMEFDRRPSAFVPQDRDRGHNPFGRAMENQDLPPPADTPDDQGIDTKSDDLMSGMNPMAPPAVVPPQGLMDIETSANLAQALEISGINVGPPNVTWETNPQFQIFQDQHQSDDSGPQKIYRDRPSRFEESEDQGRQFFPRGGGGGGGRGFRGGHGHHGGGGRMNRR